MTPTKNRLDEIDENSPLPTNTELPKEEVYLRSLEQIQESYVPKLKKHSIHHHIKSYDTYKSEQDTKDRANLEENYEFLHAKRYL